VSDCALRSEHDVFTGPYHSPSFVGLRLAEGLQLEAMGAQYDVAARAGGRRNVASSVSYG
jgi:hypothetical protein